MKGLKISRKGSGINAKCTDAFFKRELTETDIYNHVNSVSPEEAYYHELVIRGLQGLETGVFVPPMYSTPIVKGRPI
jgi:hypothetical protein